MASSTASSWSGPEEDPLAAALDRRSDRVRWEATERQGITPSPGTLALVHDLLNTRGSDDGKPDLLANLDAAQRWVDGALRAWSVRSGQPHSPCRLGFDAIAGLRDLRDALGRGSGLHTVADGTCTSTIELTFTAGEVSWHPTGGGVARLRSIVLAEVLDGQRRGTWPRLRRCRDTSCGVTFFDRTWDQRQIWHDTTKAESRKHPDRQSHSDSAPPPDTDPYGHRS